MQTNALKVFNKSALKLSHKPNQFLNVPLFKKSYIPKRKDRTTTIRQVFLDVSMVNRHIGLSRTAKDAGIDVTKLEPGEFVMFINPKRTKIALYGAHGSLTYIQSKGTHQPISWLILKHLPEIFNGTAFDYDAALKPWLEAYLKKRATSRAIPASSLRS